MRQSVCTICGYNAPPGEAIEHSCILQLQKELAVTNELLLESQKVLNAIPPCPEHGPCIPHSLEWIGNARLAMGDCEQKIINLDPKTLENALKVLRLHGFAVVHYGGHVLHQATGAPTSGTTWRDDLERAAESITQGKGEQALRFAQAVEASLFDLNKMGSAGVAVAKVISDSTGKAG